MTIVNALTGAPGTGTAGLVRSTTGKTVPAQTAEKRETRTKNRGVLK